MFQKTRNEIKKNTDPLFNTVMNGIDRMGNELVELRKGQYTRDDEIRELKKENAELKKQLGLISETITTNSMEPIVQDVLLATEVMNSTKNLKLTPDEEDKDGHK
tara:strand:+ start:955 stop:1269 length:315 start_codon:yes stop_codon:yes gene_type:complete